MRKRAARAGDPQIAVGYLRVSTEEQRLGPEAQRATIEAWAAREGIRVASWHVDDGVSGGSPIDKRPGLVEALEAVRIQTAGVLVVAKRDRVARDVEVAIAIERAVQKAGAKLVSADGAGNGDEPQDGFMRTMMNGAAEYERAIIKARTKAALAVKKQRGERTGSCPFGYRVGAAGLLVQDATEQSVIAEVHRLRGTGLSEHKIARAMRPTKYRGRSGQPLAQTQVHRILTRAGEPMKKSGPLKATLGELAGPIRGSFRSMSDPPEPVPEGTVEIETPIEIPSMRIANGQQLVDRRAAQEMRRRVVTKPDFTKDGGPCDVAWLATSCKRLYLRGRSIGAIVAALKSIGVARGDGKLLTDEDVQRLVAKADA